MTLLVLAAVIYGLVRHAHAADAVLLGALALLVVLGVIEPAVALDGFRNEGVVTIGALFVVAAGLVRTGALGFVVERLFGRIDDDRHAIRRFLPLTVLGSAFLNNTTIVAMAMPAVLQWARKRRVSPSRLLLPLSYAAVLGGVCTLIGTSTNLVVHGLMRASDHPSLADGLGMWEIGMVGVPIALGGLVFLLTLGPKLLPDRKEFIEQLGESRREYLTELIVEKNCPLIGKSIQDAGLRNLPGLFLIEIDRGQELISPVAPDETLHVGDRLIFTGVVSTIVDLQQTPGLTPAADAVYEIAPGQRHGRRLCEAVVSTSSPLVGKGIREANFRTVYNAAVVAVHRNGRRLAQKIGDIRLEAGDTLLLETGARFVEGHRNNPDFYLVSDIGEASSVRHERAWVAASITLLLVVLLSMPEILRWMPVDASLPARFASLRAAFALLAAGLMIATRCVSVSDARRSIDWGVLMMIAASFGVGDAIESSGLATAIADGSQALHGGWGPVPVLAGVFLLTWLLTELMSNNAAAALMFPIAVASAGAAGADPRAFAVAVAVGASCGFILPAGYQTHLMVLGPGGYRVSDFARVGIPMVAIWTLIAVLLIPLAWKL